MKYSEYLKHIFDEADLLSEKYGVGYRSLESVYIAMLREHESDFDGTETERGVMSYIIAQTHGKTRGKLMEVLLRKKTDCMLGEDALADALKDAEARATRRGYDTVTADLLLEAVLPRLTAQFGVNLLSPLEEFLWKAVADAADNAPKHTADKLASQIARDEEKQRAEKELFDLINRAPAEKIGDEAELRSQILGQIKITHGDKFTEVILPFFFPDSAEPLTLRLTEADGTVYVTDSGRCCSELCRRCGGETALVMTKYFARIEHEAEVGADGCVTVPLRDSQRFIDYLRTLSRIDNADLYPTVNGEYYESYAKYSEEYSFPKEGAAAKDFTDALLDRIKVTYDRDLGCLFHLPYYFEDEACPMSVSIGRDYLTDHGDFDGGRLFERMCYLNEDITVHRQRIGEICQRFRCVWEGETVSRPYDNEDDSSLPRALFDFLQAASVLGEIGHFIVL